MPELPEVQTVVDTLRPRLTGRRIGSVVHLRGDIVVPKDCDLRSCIVGRRVSSIARRGKRIVMTLDNSQRFFIHLGMSGKLIVSRSREPRRPHTHFIAAIGGGEQLRFIDPRRFGGIFWLGENPGDDGLGPEPLTLRPSQLLHRLGRTSRPVKAALLDQSVIAGIGNIYADETLFAANIHPLRAANTVATEEVRKLVTALKRVLRKAIRHRGSSLRDYVDANGESGKFQLLHNVYDRAGQPCRVCGRAIQRIVVAQRTTCFCAGCQK